MKQSTAAATGSAWLTRLERRDALAMNANSVDPAGQLEAVLRALRVTFLGELPERCDRLEQAVLALEAGQAAESAYEDLFRNVHSLKGTGGTFGLQIITNICHQFESFLSDSHSRYTQAFASAALAYIDLLRQVGELAGATASPDFSPIEAVLERLRTALLRSRRPVLIAEPSATMRSLYQQSMADLPLQVSLVDNGIAALDRLLHQPFELLIVARELGALNGTALVAALRESNCKNKGIPVILVSSSREAIPEHLRIDHFIQRDLDLINTLPSKAMAALGLP
jgi:CheY-like chemotaxis protein/HPt (histidine-containing phosphotransfer) domain-containing protein